MKEHDPRCEPEDDQILLNDVANHGWHVIKILDRQGSPGWAFSIGLFHNFNHPEVLIFGLDLEMMHSIINDIGEKVRAGEVFAEDQLYPGFIEAYSCTFKNMNRVWYEPFLGYANWFYKGMDYPAQQCFWPDRDQLFPWQDGFNPKWLWAQPLLFQSDSESALAVELLETLDS